MDLAGRLGCQEKELVSDDAYVGDREPEQDRGKRFIEWEREEDCHLVDDDLRTWGPAGLT